MDCVHSIRVLCVLGRSNGKGVSPPLPQRDGTLIRRHRPVAASIDAELTEAWRRLSPQSAPVGTRSSASAPAAIGFAAMQGGDVGAVRPRWAADGAVSDDFSLEQLGRAPGWTTFQPKLTTEQPPRMRGRWPQPLAQAVERMKRLNPMCSD